MHRARRRPPSGRRTPGAGARAVRRAGSVLVLALTALATALGVQLSGAPTAQAATGPTAVDDSGSVSVSQTEVSIPALANDVAGRERIRPELTVFPADQPGTTVSEDGRYLNVLGFGPFRINEGGRITFDPQGVTGRRTVRYRITDAGGLSAEATVTVTVTAGARSDELDTTQGASVSQDILADDRPGRNADGSPGTIDRSSLRFRASQPAPVTVSADGLVVTFDKVGVFRIDATTRILTFTPEFAYVSENAGYALYYTAQDTTLGDGGLVEHHQISATVRWTVTPLSRLTIHETASPDLFFHVGDPLTFTTTITNVATTPVDALTLNHSLGRRLSADSCTPVKPGGTLPAGTSTTCTATTRATQQDLDVAARVEDTVVTTATATQDGHTVTARAQNGAHTGSRITQGLAMTATTNRTSVSAPGDQIDYAFVVRNKGNRSVRDLVVSSSSPGVTALVCAPVPLGGTLGDNRSTTCRASKTVVADDFQYAALSAGARATAVPVSGYHATSANTRLTVNTYVDGSHGVPVEPVPPGAPPTATPDTAQTTVGRPVITDVLANDRPRSAGVPLVGSSVRLRTVDALPAGSALYGDAKTLKVAGRGVFLVSGTGQITFVPLGGATGPVPTVGYQVADAAGTTARSTLTT